MVALENENASPGAKIFIFSLEQGPQFINMIKVRYIPEVALRQQR
jgi:hypothetical protein